MRVRGHRERAPGRAEAGRASAGIGKGPVANSKNEAPTASTEKPETVTGLLFDESEYEQLRKHYLEKKQYRDATLPHNGMRLRRQVRPAIIDSNTPWTCSPLPPAPGALSPMPADAVARHRGPFGRAWAHLPTAPAPGALSRRPRTRVPAAARPRGPSPTPTDRVPGPLRPGTPPRHPLMFVPGPICPGILQDF
jgi:hypothetical protein